MILLVDSGSTKTRWVSLVDGRENELVTEGLNPRLTNDNAFCRIFVKVMEWGVSGDAVEKVWFYGAGCGTREAQTRMVRTLANSLGIRPERVCVAGDLLGACRATCGTSAGWVGILGTGSNLCFYDGIGIARQRVSTGFLLGDEGSGNHIGRRLLKDYLEERMPNNISTMFHDAYNMSADQFINRIYCQPNPNRFLASLATFADQHQREPYIAAVLEECFGSFFDRLDEFGGTQSHPLHLVGGITQSFSRTLEQMAALRGITLGVMVGDPMPGLIDYHKNNNPCEKLCK